MGGQTLLAAGTCISVKNTRKTQIDRNSLFIYINATLVSIYTTLYFERRYRLKYFKNSDCLFMAFCYNMAFYGFLLFAMFLSVTDPLSLC